LFGNTSLFTRTIEFLAERAKTITSGKVFVKGCFY